MWFPKNTFSIIVLKFLLVFPVLKEVDLLEEVEEKGGGGERENVHLSVLVKREKRNGLEILIGF